MGNLIVIAGVIPFAIILVALVLLTTVRYSVTGTHLKLRILWITIRSVRLFDITSVELLPDSTHGRGKILTLGDTVVVRHMPGDKAFFVITRQPERLMEELRARVKEATGREV